MCSMALYAPLPAMNNILADKYVRNGGAVALATQGARST